MRVRNRRSRDFSGQRLRRKCACVLEHVTPRFHSPLFSPFSRSNLFSSVSSAQRDSITRAALESRIFLCFYYKVEASYVFFFASPFVFFFARASLRKLFLCKATEKFPMALAKLGGKPWQREGKEGGWFELATALSLSLFSLPPAEPLLFGPLPALFPLFFPSLSCSLPPPLPAPWTSPFFGCGGADSFRDSSAEHHHSSRPGLREILGTEDLFFLKRTPKGVPRTEKL